MSNKVVWLIGGGVMQLPMAKEIKRRGYKLLIADSDPNCVCRPLADYFADVSIYSARDCLAFARSLSFNPAAVLTVATDAGIEVSTIAEYFGLPAAPVTVAKRVRNKAMMREILELPYPRFRTGVIQSHFTDWDLFPCVVKPGDNSGSKGFSVVRDRDGLWPALQRAQQANRTGNIVLVEEFLQPENVMPELEAYDTAEIALDFFVYSGQVHWANGALRLFWKDRPGIEAGHFNPYQPDDSIIQQVQDVANKMHITFGPLKVDFMRDERYGWVLQEMATRLSGGLDHMYTCPMATGKGITGAMLDLALGKPLDLDKITAKWNRHACCIAPVFKPGKIKRWLGPEDNVFYLAQDEIKPLISNSDRSVFIIRDGETREEALKVALEAVGKVEAVYDN